MEQRVPVGMPVVAAQLPVFVCWSVLAEVVAQQFENVHHARQEDSGGEQSRGFHFLDNRFQFLGPFGGATEFFGKVLLLFGRKAGNLDSLESLAGCDTVFVEIQFRQNLDVFLEFLIAVEVQLADSAENAVGEFLLGLLYVLEFTQQFRKQNVCRRNGPVDGVVVFQEIIPHGADFLFQAATVAVGEIAEGRTPRVLEGSLCNGALVDHQ